MNDKIEEKPLEQVQEYKNIVKKPTLMEKIEALTDKQKKSLTEIAGTRDPLFAFDILLKLESSLPYLTKDYSTGLTVCAMRELSPKNPIEAMLYSQLMALHVQGLENLKHNPTDAIKLLRQQQATIDNLMKLKRQSAPSMTVQNISMNQVIFNSSKNIEDRGGSDQTCEVPHGYC